MSRSIISVDSSSNFGGHTTITSALRNNVTIYVHKGTYTENLDFTGLTGIIIYCLPGVVLSGTITAQTTNKIIYAERKIYKAVLAQTGTSAPSEFIVGFNNFGSIVWTYSDIGIYRGTLAGAFKGTLVSNAMLKMGSTTIWFIIEKDSDSTIDLITQSPPPTEELEGLLVVEFEML